MSHVTGVVVMFSTDREPEATVRAINAFFPDDRPGLVLLTPYMGGTKHPQYDVAGAGINNLEIPRFLAHLRGLAWDTDAAHGYGWATVALQDEHDNGVGVVQVYRHPQADGAGLSWREAR
jgi:hypothetical protein